MARAYSGRKKPGDRHYRCARCHSPIVWNYLRCSVCGFDHNGHLLTPEQIVTALKREFPGSKELYE